MRYSDENDSIKIKWEGTIRSIQPRTRVWRYITHNRTHFHVGYNIFFAGKSEEGLTEFSIAISEKQQQKGNFQIGDRLKGTAWTKRYPKREFADYYRAGSLKILQRDEKPIRKTCPWTGRVPEMDTYEKRGARMLSKSLWKGKCFTCYWATMSNVEIQWDFDRNIKRYRFESFCYGPKSCKNYKMGRSRSVPYKNRDSATDDGWLDAICTENRDWDD